MRNEKKQKRMSNNFNLEEKSENEGRTKKKRERSKISLYYTKKVVTMEAI